MPNLKDISRLIARAALRLSLNRFIQTFILLLTVAAGAALLARLIQKLIAYPFDWTLASMIAVGAVALGALLYIFFTRPAPIVIARTIDERANLRETISTAVCVAQHTDSWSRAAVAQATNVSRKVDLRKVLPIRAPRTWPWPLVLMLLFGLSGLLPQYDVLSLLSRANAAEAENKALIDARAEAQEAEKKLSEVLAQVDDGALADQLKAEEPATEPVSPEEVRRTAIKKLTTAQDRLKQLMNTDPSGHMEELEKRLAQLRQPGPGPLESLSKSLQRGDFQQAQKELEKLLNQIASGELSEAQKQQLSEQLANLAEQLKELAERQAELEDALKQAGLDPALAKASPEALQKAIEQAQNLTPEQKQALQNLASQCSKCSNSSRNLANAMAAAGNFNMNGMDPGAFSDLAQQLSSLEMLQQDLSSLSAAAQKLDAELLKLCQGLGQCEGSGLSMKPGVGAGQQGRGGGFPEEQPADFGTEKQKSTTHTQAGPIIGSMMVEGDTIRGESVQTFTQAVRTGSATAAEAIETNRIPREYHELIKGYFGRLEESGAAPTDKPSQESPAATGSDK